MHAGDSVTACVELDKSRNIILAASYTLENGQARIRFVVMELVIQRSALLIGWFGARRGNFTFRKGTKN